MKFIFLVLAITACVSASRHQPSKSQLHPQNDVSGMVQDIFNMYKGIQHKQNGLVIIPKSTHFHCGRIASYKQVCTLPPGHKITIEQTKQIYDEIIQKSPSILSFPLSIIFFGRAWHSDYSDFTKDGYDEDPRNQGHLRIDSAFPRYRGADPTRTDYKKTVEEFTLFIRHDYETSTLNKQVLDAPGPHLQITLKMDNADYAG